MFSSWGGLHHMNAHLSVVKQHQPRGISWWLLWGVSSVFVCSMWSDVIFIIFFVFWRIRRAPLLHLILCCVSWKENRDDSIGPSVFSWCDEKRQNNKKKKEADLKSSCGQTWNRFSPGLQEVEREHQGEEVTSDDQIITWCLWRRFVIFTPDSSKWWWSLAISIMILMQMMRCQEGEEMGAGDSNSGSP